MSSLALDYPDGRRIAALSVAISLNAAMLLLALHPLPVRETMTYAPTAVPIRLIPARPPARARPLRTVRPRMPVHITPMAHALRVPLSVPGVRPSPMSTPFVADSLPSPAPVTQTTAPAPSIPVGAPLAYLRAPAPRYPLAARRAGLQGTVTLEVLVDRRGRPLQAIIARGSGHPVLDRAARRKVLRDWRFVPARVDGRVTRAWALVPVVFRLASP